MFNLSAIAIIIFMAYYYMTTSTAVATMMTSTKVSFVQRHFRCCFIRNQQQKETRLVSMSSLSSSMSSSSSLLPLLRRRRIRMFHDKNNGRFFHRNMVCLSGASSSSTNMDLYRKRQHRLNKQQQQQEQQQQQQQQESIDQQQQSDQQQQNHKYPTIGGTFKVPGMSDKRNHTSSIVDTSTNNNTITTSSSYHRGVHVVYNTKPPIDPNTLLTSSNHDDTSTSYLLDCTNQLHDWMKTRNHHNIIALTGAGISTESGIPDYRGSNGSYYKGHQPMTHDQFIKSIYNRKRYWGRSMIGWRFVDQLQPNSGHLALATLEKKGIIGVEFDDNIDYYNEEVGIHQVTDTDNNNQTRRRRLSLITQNVDSFHRKAGMKDFIELHGRNDQLVCMNCGHIHDRHAFQSDLDHINHDWYQNVLLLQQQLQEEENSSSSLRPDGDASLHKDINYDEMTIPSCKQCHIGFYKPNVVFFGDRVPSGRSLLCHNAILNSYNSNDLSSSLVSNRKTENGCNGILVMGTSLAVHSAYKYIRLASQNNIPICIINVGETRAEIEQLSGITKIEAPIGPLLSSLISTYYN